MADESPLHSGNMDNLRKELQNSHDLILRIAIDGVHILDRKATLVEMSDSFCQMLGYDDPEELRGRSVSFWDAQETPEFIRKKVRDLIEGTGHRSLGSFETIHRRRDGSTFPVEVRITPFTIGNDTLLYCSSRDITQRKQDESLILRQSQMGTLLVTCHRILSETSDESLLLQKICDQAVAKGCMALAFIAVPDKKGNLRIRASSGDTDRIADAPLSTHAKGSEHALWQKPTPLFFDAFPSPSPDPWITWAHKNALGSGALLPLFRNERRWGILELFHSRPGAFDPLIRDLIGELSQILSRGLDRLDMMNYQTLMSNALSAVGEGVLITDARQRVIFANNAFSAISGYGRDEITGENCNILQGPKTDPETVAKIRRALREGQSFQGEIFNYRKDGTTFWNLLSISPVRAPDGSITQFVGVQRDITAIVEMNRRLEYDSRHDRLTTLPNRRALEDHLERSVARAQRNGTHIAVGMLDLDDFKPVNDTLGHEAGDRLLQELSQRMRDRLRSSDFLARLGGDEFVVVIEDLPASESLGRLESVLSRLHSAVERPFPLSQGQEFSVDMSLGLAIYPTDATTPDTLLRLADAAMYQSKSDKHRRSRWWQRGVLALPAGEETPFDPYGMEAALLLETHRDRLEGIVDRFLDSFYSALATQPERQFILDGLTPQELETLRIHQKAHLLHLLGPNTTSAKIRERSQIIGEIHTLAGVSGAMLLDAESLYSRLLINEVNEALLSSRDRYRIVLVSEARLQEDIQAQLRSEAATVDSYMTRLPMPLPRRGSHWTDALKQEVGLLGALPGVRAALFLRPDSQGRFRVEDSGGLQSKALSIMLQSLDYDIFRDSEESPGSRGSLLTRVWRDQQIGCIPSIHREIEDPWVKVWHDGGLRSLVAIPIANPSGQPVGILILGGAFPNQFSTSWIQQFSRSLKQRWEQVWALCNTPGTLMDEDLATRYRRRLFSGGLSMAMQPVVDLRTGRLVKVEALARLSLQDGTIIMPNVFLPLLGEAELDRLFRVGLDQALCALARWTSEGLTEIGVSVNLAPSTLLLPECSRWVKETLEKYGIEAHRLTLEILETQDLSIEEQEEAVRRLVSMGIVLAMDDLGSGYSSLHRLSSLPFDNVKVDFALLSRIRAIPLETLGMIAAIVQMGREFGHEVVIEGLEDDGMIEAATFLGAQLGQGFQLAKPMEADKIPAWSHILREPVRPDTLKTWLGALAYHWKIMHSDVIHPHPNDYESCPLTRFFHDKGPSEATLARIHREIHNPGTDLFVLSRSLTLELVHRIRQEAAQASPGS